MSASAFAAEQQGKRDEFGIGIAAISQSSGYNIGSESLVVPAFLINYGDFSLLGPQAKYTLFQDNDFKLDFTGALRLDGYSADDDDFFIGLDDRDSTIDLGFSMEYELGPIDVSFSLAADALNKHDGFQSTLTFGHNFRFESAMISPFIGMEYRSKNLVDYYYGVKNHETTATRAFYQGESATQAIAGIQGLWWSGQHHRIISRLQFSSLDSSIKDSPLVDESSSYQFIMGYAYVF